MLNSPFLYSNGMPETECNVRTAVGSSRSVVIETCNSILPVLAFAPELKHRPSCSALSSRASHSEFESGDDWDV